MSFQISFGTGGPRPQAVYDFTDWTLLPPSRLPSDAARVVYRPSARTFVRRLGGTALAACIVAGLFWLRYELKAETHWRELSTVCVALAGFVGLLGVLYPVSCLWNRLVVDRDYRGGLVVQTWRVLPRTSTWPVGSFSRVYVLAQSVVAGRRNTRRQLGYRWQVRLEGTSAIEFRPDFQKEPPMPGEFSPRTAQFLSTIQQLTGLSCAAPVIVDPTGPRTNVLRGRIAGNGDSSISFVQSETKSFRSIDDVPQELRAQFSQLLAEAAADPASSRGGAKWVVTDMEQTIRVVDAAGRERMYHSLAEVPSELLAPLLKHHPVHATPIDIPPQELPEGMHESSTIVFRDAQGVEHVYKSLEEMPPEVRAIYEQVHRDLGKP